MTRISTPCVLSGSLAALALSAAGAWAGGPIEYHAPTPTVHVQLQTPKTPNWGGTGKGGPNNQIHIKSEGNPAAGPLLLQQK
jgi:hypothetical protein